MKKAPALAMISALFGLDIELVMPDTATKERVQTMKAYGAKVTLHPEGIEGARDYAISKVTNEGYFSVNQFENDNNSELDWMKSNGWVAANEFQTQRSFSPAADFGLNKDINGLY